MKRHRGNVPPLITSPVMAWNNKNSDHGTVSEKGFEITSQGRTVPGVYWRPAEAESEHLVLLGHGGTTHKKAEYITQIAHGLAAMGISAMAIDGPGHGERSDDANALGDYDLERDDFARKWHGGGGTDAVVADWSASLDFIEAEAGARPTGWWGLSMGTMMGLPVAANDPRISVAVLGLMGSWGPNGDDLMRLAGDVQIPLRFLVQWDDQLIPRKHCLELFDELGAKRKTLHANPGEHSAVPHFEVIASLQYLAHNLAKV